MWHDEADPLNFTSLSHSFTLFEHSAKPREFALEDTPFPLLLSCTGMGLGGEGYIFLYKWKTVLFC
jgi:hypothetical protein